MALRVTKVYASALGSGDGKIRVSRQMLEVLVANTVSGTEIEVDASNALSLTQTVEVRGTRSLSVASTLSLDQVANTEFPVTVASTITFVDVARVAAIEVEVASTLSLVGAADIRDTIIQNLNQALGLSQILANNFKVVSVASALGLTQSAYDGKRKTAAVETALGLTQLGRQNRQSADAANSLELEQHIIYRLNDDIFVTVDSEIGLVGEATLEPFAFRRQLPDGIYESPGVYNNASATYPGETLNLEGTVTYIGSRRVSVASPMTLSHLATTNFIKSLTIQQLIPLQQVLRRIKTASALNELALVSAAERVFKETSSLNLTHLAEISNTKVGASALAFVQTLVVRMTRSLQLSNSISFQQFLLPEVDFAIFRPPVYTPVPSDLEDGIVDITRPKKTTKIYTQYESLQSTYPGVVLTPPTFTPQQMEFFYPTVTPTLNVTVRNPGFGNQQRLNFTRVRRQLRGGEPITYSDPKWPMAEILFFELPGLTDAQAASLESFLKTTVGLTVGLTDWEGQTWHGIVLTPNAEFTHVGKCVHSVQIEFQGVKA